MEGIVFRATSIGLRDPFVRYYLFRLKPGQTTVTVRVNVALHAQQDEIYRKNLEIQARMRGGIVPPRVSTSIHCEPYGP